ncbi:DUF1631 domain-containing protein [Pseudomonas sp.]|uniref:DUF1631 domain-containing protein n=1 Tax=Pseudomonas sp. TaxID=306 RepID=UPI0028A7475B|nr:DUF1631 domain-containing protein [Pseudomonas sp.]
MNDRDSSKPPVATGALASRIIQPRFSELVQRCRKLVMNHLAEHLIVAFAQVDDTLFECAEKAENNQVQSLFFDSMRDIRKLRPQVERAYHQRIAGQFADFLQGKLSPGATGDALEADDLRLVQNEDYEETLQIINMVSRVKARCAQRLFALDCRLALLNNGQKLEEDSNPFGPHAIAQAFREALQPTPLSLRIKIILYMLFDRHLMQNLDGLYEALNRELIEAGILPNMKYQAQRRAEPARTPPVATGPAAPFAGTADARAGYPDGRGPPAEEAERLFDGLTQLFIEFRKREGLTLLGGKRSVASYAPPTATRTFEANDLLDALNQLQRQAAEDFARRMQQPQQVDGLKAELHRQLDSHSATPGQRRISDQEADVIDLVGMLFDFILNDGDLPDACKTALSHLHTPYLRVAMQDRALFTQYHHPARLLLNAMARAGVLYGSEGEERELLAKIQWVVERVIQGFSGELALFDTLLEEFNEFVGTLKHRVELREKRAIEAAKGRDRLLDARQKAGAVIAETLRGPSLPKIIRDFLELTWTDVLVFVQLRHGEGSAEWTRALELAEQLAWSGRPQDAVGVERLRSLRVAMLDDLRKGLELLGGYHEDGIRRLLQDIVASQHAVQAKRPELADKLKPALIESPLATMLGEDAVLLEDSRAARPPRTPRQEMLVRQLETLEFGTWFDFIEGARSRRLKLSWFSPTTSNYMFVDQQGQRVAIRPIAELADEMDRGLARIVAQERSQPLMDRAMNAIYRALQRVSGRSPDQGNHHG